jgi:hypothetical protein
VSKILAAHPVRPHKIEYYLERRDAEFEDRVEVGGRTSARKTKMIEVLHVYREVAVWRKTGLPREVVGVLSYDEKPGIQAIGNTAPDSPPVPGRHATLGRDHEYQRYGTLSLLAGIDLRSGEVLGLVRERHRSQEFVEFPGLANQHYPPGSRIRVVLDNHSAHVSRETRAYLTSVPNRFEFVFTPSMGRGSIWWNQPSIRLRVGTLRSPQLTPRHVVPGPTPREILHFFE